MAERKSKGTDKSATRTRGATSESAGEDAPQPTARKSQVKTKSELQPLCSVHGVRGCTATHKRKA